MAKLSKKEFGRRLAALRRKAGFTQEEAARSMGISALTVSRWERGTQFPDLASLNDLARTYGVEVSELFAAPARTMQSSEDAAIEKIVARLRTGDLEDIQRAAKVLKALYDPLPRRAKFPKKRKRKKTISG